MCNDNRPPLLMEVFRQLTIYWQTEYHPKEIGSDLGKIQLMQAVNTLLKDTSHEVPPEVLNLYQKVFLRDVWGKK